MSCHLQIVGRTSAWINPDAADAELAKSSSQALSQELAWAAFLGLQAVIIQPPPGSHLVNLAQLVNKVRQTTRHGSTSYSRRWCGGWLVWLSCWLLAAAMPSCSCLMWYTNHRLRPPQLSTQCSMLLTLRV